MPTQSDDRFLWVAVGLCLVLAWTIIPSNLRYMRKVTEVTHDQDGNKEGGENAEDNITVDTLQRLAAGSSYNIRTCAIKIVAERCTKGPARDLLLTDIASNNPQHRDKAVDALWLLLYSPALREMQMAVWFTDSLTFESVITGLVNLLPFHRQPTSKDDKSFSASPVKPPDRPPAERTLMIILHFLLLNLRPNISTALSAGLVSRWLAKYPFPCALECNGSRRQDVYDLFKRDAWDSDDPLMAEIMHVLAAYPEGLKHFRQHGLRASNFSETIDDRGHGHISVIRPIIFNGQDLPTRDGASTAGSRPVYRPRTSNADSQPALPWSRSHRVFDRGAGEEEELRRRRRREAIVINDGEPLRRDNILQRENSSVGLRPIRSNNTGSGIEELLAQLGEGTDREDGGLTATSEALEGGRSPPAEERRHVAMRGDPLDMGDILRASAESARREQSMLTQQTVTSDVGIIDTVAGAFGRWLPGSSRRQPAMQPIDSDG